MHPIDFLWRRIACAPDLPAVIGEDRTYSYADLGRAVQDRAVSLLRLDDELGGKVAIGAANTVDHLLALLSSFAAGKVWVPLNPRSGTPEIQRIIEFVRPGVILGDADMAGRLNPLGIDVIDVAAIGKDSVDAGTALPFGPQALTDLPSESPMAVKFTGGTTGQPKGVIQTFRTWTANIVTQVHELGLTERDRYLVAAPITHGTGTYMMPLFAAGGALVFPNHSDPEGMLDAIEKHRVTLFFAPATLIMKLAEVQKAHPRDLSSLRLVIYGGAPMRPEQIRQAQAVFGPIICATYGQTEAPQIITFLPPDELTDDRIASVGRPSLMTRVAILDSDGRMLPAGEVGEIAVRGDLVMGGYLDAPEETGKTLVNGWLRTGDSGLIDDQGYLFLRDRLRDVIITGGFNVYPSDVETVLASHPAVADCAVVGIPDDKWGEAVHAAVELKAGATVTAETLTALVREQLGPVKTPKQIHFFDDLPRSAVAKVLKPAIRNVIQAKDLAR
ncbi:class I adenylate-forming enzyme family protein [Paracoccus shandongensis]|uniref:class I adenylate-forming enzyme family protein n=1 Tax=Paracoccus shandongensis TaxID=2816048 RepID=UPI001A8D7972|nr:AMP-binding protein [Paracoccus shandongensis]